MAQKLENNDHNSLYYISYQNQMISLNSIFDNISSQKLNYFVRNEIFIDIEYMRLFGFNEHFFTLWYGLLHEIQSIQISFHWKQISARKGVVNFDESNLTPSIIK